MAVPLIIDKPAPVVTLVTLPVANPVKPIVILFVLLSVNTTFGPAAKVTIVCDESLPVNLILAADPFCALVTV